MTVERIAEDLQGAAGEERLPEYEKAKEFYAKYEVKNVLGKGVSSTVRKCVEKATSKDFAVKVIDLTNEKNDVLSPEEMVAITRKEMNILRICAGQPYIIELHDAFESPTYIFLVLELCKRGELFDYLTEVVRLSEKRARVIMKQLLESVAFLHDNGVVHRDLKPENILLDDNLNMKLSDFGFATIISNDYELTELVGTPGYLAPETLKTSYQQAEGYGKPVDILAGFPPFWNRKQIYMLRAIMEGQYSFDSPEWNEVSDTAKDLISRMLTVDPELRITARQALAHPFLKVEEGPVEKEKKRRLRPISVFRAGVHVVVGVRHIQQLRLHPKPLNIAASKGDPYGQRLVRKVIDAGAFRIYGHWVKRGENQDRAALFEITPKKDLKDTKRPAAIMQALFHPQPRRQAGNFVKQMMARSSSNALF